MATEVKSLTADELLSGLPDLRGKPVIVAVDLPELGEGKRVYVRAMTSADLDRYDAGTYAAGEANDNFRARFVAACCCDEAGSLLFPLPAQVVALGNRSPAVVGRIFAAARELNPPLREAVVDEKKGSAGAP